MTQLIAWLLPRAGRVLGRRVATCNKYYYGKNARFHLFWGIIGPHFKRAPLKNWPQNFDKGKPLFAPGRQLAVAERGRNVLAIPGEGDVEVDGRGQREDPPFATTQP